jgi:hypothetical protein
MTTTPVAPSEPDPLLDMLTEWEKLHREAQRLRSAADAVIADVPENLGHSLNSIAECERAAPGYGTLYREAEVLENSADALYRAIRSTEARSAAGLVAQLGLLRELQPFEEDEALIDTIIAGVRNVLSDGR